MPRIPRPQLLRRIEALVAAEEVTARPFDLTQVCFPKQQPFALDRTRFSTAVCTRRAGKTVGIAAKLLDVAKRKAGCVAVYITRSRVNAKRIFWRILKHMNEEYSLGGDPAEGELSITLGNGSMIYLSGCMDEGEIENFRGLPIGIVVLDEAQSLPQWIERLVDEVLAPALMDYDGQLVLVGTPGPVPVGYFHECAHNPKWAHHAWTVFDNPFIEVKSGKTPQRLLEEELERSGKTLEDPVIQREWFARWILDPNALVFRYSEALNAKSRPTKHEYYVMGVDLGFDDADAIAVLGWSDDSPEVELVEEHVMTKQLPSALAKKVEEVLSRYPDMLAQVWDMGGLGKKIASEYQSRFSLPLEAAEKDRKLEHIELLNDALRTGKFWAPKSSRFAHDCALVEWDKKNPEKWKIGSQFHSDICDAVLYAYRRALHWLHEPPPPERPKRGTPEALELERAEQQNEETQRVEEAFAAHRQQRQEEEWL